MQQPEFKLRSVSIVAMKDQFRDCKVMLLPSDSEAADVVLGRDWYNMCIGAEGSGEAGCNGLVAEFDKIFDHRSPSECVFKAEPTTLVEMLREHGLDTLRGSTEGHRKAILRHILLGKCVGGIGTSCRSIRLLGAGRTRNDLIAFGVTKLQLYSSTVLPNAALAEICDALGVASCALGVESRSRYLILLREFQKVEDALVSRENIICAENISGKDLEDQNLGDLKILAYLHGIEFSSNTPKHLKDAICSHLARGDCVELVWDGVAEDGQHSHSACIATQRQATQDQQGTAEDNFRLKVRLFSLQQGLAHCKSVRSLKRLVKVLSLVLPKKNSVRGIRRLLKKYIRTLVIGKYPKGDIPGFYARQDREGGVPLHEPQSIDGNWPKVVSKTLKEKIVKLFREETSRKSLRSFVCSVCGGRYRQSEGRERMLLNEVPTELLRCETDEHYNAPGLSSSKESYLCPFESGPLKALLINKLGVHYVDNETYLDTCLTCYHDLIGKRLPQLALANGLALGAVPAELRDLSPVEEMLIARNRAKCCIVQLRETGPPMPNLQRGLKGHVIVFPQNPDNLCTILPANTEELAPFICVVFVGSTRPSEEWVRSKARPLLVRRQKVRDALIWLKNNNPLYSDIRVDEDRLSLLPEKASLPVHVQYRTTTEAGDIATSGYDPLMTQTQLDRFPEQDETPFENVVVANVEANASMNALRSAAMRHLKTPGKGFIEIPHGTDPVNEFSNPDLFPLMYPTLFPYGVGGLEDPKRSRPVSMQNHIKHLFRLEDRRFQEHYSFLFTAFNILQRRQALLQTKLKVDAPRFNHVASAIAGVSVEAIHAVTERVTRGDTTTAYSDEERQVLELMKEVKMVTSHVPGSAASRIAMRNEIRALMMSEGMPSFFLTINPADVYNPLVTLLSGKDIDIDNLLPEQIPKYWEQSILIARNPTIGAQFFNLYMKAFFKCVLGICSGDPEIDLHGGILGKVKAYYGCVEAQGRGSLHCHMMIWIEGALNPDEIRRRIMEEPEGEFVKNLLEMLDDTISRHIPYDDGHDDLEDGSHPHPCSIRGANQNSSQYPELRKADIRRLVQCCQVHTHTHTCYKYWKGPPEPRDCRFDLDEKNVRPISVVDPDTGEVHLRCLHGLVNNFNEIILEAVRCNMDIKFIGSGQSAKAIIYYITDYITKSQLKAHVAFAALELAAAKLGQYNPTEDLPTVRAKRLLQKCAYAMISHQELSAQQVVSYLMGYEDHFTSHQYRGLWWTSFERMIDRQIPNRQECDISEADDQEGLSEGSEGLIPYDEVIIGSDESAIVPRMGQAADYVHRGDDLRDISVWDFVAQVDKVGMRRRRGSREKKSPEAMIGSDPEQLNPQVYQNMVDSEDSDSQAPSGILNLPKHCLIRSRLTAQHMQAESHILRLRLFSKRFVPVTLGPSLPRRDRVEQYERYCKVMLLLFKPWRAAHDLKRMNETWVEAFNKFQSSQCSPRLARVMNNMQLIHECKDSRDDHFSRRRNRGQFGLQGNISSWVDDEANATIESDELPGEDVNEEILAHLVDMDRSRSQRWSRMEESAASCVKAARNAGIIGARAATTATKEPSGSDRESESSSAHEVNIDLEKTDHREAKWRAAYEQRRHEQRQRLAQASSQVDAVEIAGHQRIINPQVRVHHEAENMALRSTAGLTPSGADSHNGSGSDTVEALIGEYSLNKEQARAFRIVCCTATDKESSKTPLRMYIGGSGGTGKSRVIAAIHEFFRRRRESRRLRLTAYTGIAAHNIGGSTLHSALSLRQRTGRKKVTNQAKADLMKLWDGVDFLIVDEVSMIGCQTMVDIHEALMDAKDSDRTFGGMNMIFAGDFAQLPPVGQTRLYTQLNSRAIARCGTTAGQKNVFGRLLWLQVETVVLLKTLMRQVGPENQRFIDLLENLRHGKCTDSDYALLCRRTASEITREDPKAGERWAGCPIVVADNLAKDRLNEEATEAFARRSGISLNWYHSIDSHQGRSLDDPRIIEELSKYHSGLTSYRLSKLPLVKGMPVLLCQNYDVEGGIVNGTFGTVKQVRYVITPDGHRHARSCIIQSMSGRENTTLPDLDEADIVALGDTVDIPLQHPHSLRRLTVKRTQLPILPAFAITVYKAQGLTLNYAVVDLQSCMGTEAAYVMLSRVKSLDGVLILRPFDKAKICGGQSNDLREEYARLEGLDLLTQLVYTQDSKERRSIESLIAGNPVPRLSGWSAPAVPVNDPAALVDAFQDQVRSFWLNCKDVQPKRPRKRKRP